MQPTFVIIFFQLHGGGGTCWFANEQNSVSYTWMDLLSYAINISIFRLNDSNLREENITEILRSCIHLEYLDLQNSISSFPTSNLPVCYEHVIYVHVLVLIYICIYIYIFINFNHLSNFVSKRVKWICMLEVCFQKLNKLNSQNPNYSIFIISCTAEINFSIFTFYIG